MSAFYVLLAIVTRYRDTSRSLESIRH